MGGFFSIGLRLCFPGDATVMLEDGSKKGMSAVRLGERVLVAKEDGTFGFDTVYGFLHRETNRRASYRQIHLGGDSPTVITLSENHMIHRVTSQGGIEIVPAGEVTINDSLIAVQYDSVSSAVMNSPAPVMAIQNVEKEGIYAPLTFSGTIVVDNTLASCYAEFENMKSHNVAHAALKPLRLRAKMRRNLHHHNPREGWSRYCMVLGAVSYPFLT